MKLSCSTPLTPGSVLTLTEPLVWSSTYRLNLQQQVAPYPCTVVTEIVRPRGVVPHVLPGTNEMIKQYPDRMKIPFETIWAGAETMYPEYRQKLRGTR